MAGQLQSNYYQIVEAIDHIQASSNRQHSLYEPNESADSDPSEFQGLFMEWAGVSPGEFMKYLEKNYIRKLLEDQRALFDASYQKGLSDTGHLHEDWVSIERMTPDECNNGGENLSIHYSHTESPYGNVLVAFTKTGICHAAFFENKQQALTDLKARFPKARYDQEIDEMQRNAMANLAGDGNKTMPVKLHLKGTSFQFQVWEALLKIPVGRLSTYGTIAKEINRPQAARAIGAAIGSNPVAFLIPCHRVIHSSGSRGGYRWGSNRKAVMIGWEAARINVE